MQFQIGFISDEPTPHRIGLPQGEVFKHPKHFKEWCAPILSVDLSEMNPQWEGQVHFLYFHHESNSATFLLEGNRYAALLQDFDEAESVPPADFIDVFEADEEFEDLSEMPMESGGVKMGSYVGFKVCDLPELDEEKDVFEWRESAHPIIEQEFLAMQANGEVLFESVENVFLGGHPWWIQSPGGLGNNGEDGWCFIGQVYLPFFSEWCAGYYQYLYYNPEAKKVMIENYLT